MYTITDTKYGTLRFEKGDEDLYREYVCMERDMKFLFYRLLRSRHGIWASNQGKYVQSRDQLNEWDSKTLELAN